MSPPGDKLILSDPTGSRHDGNAALGQRSPEELIVQRLQLDDANKRIAELEKGNAALEKAIAKNEQIAPPVQSAGSGKARHVAHAEGWKAICTAPDFCKVGGSVVAFTSVATLDQKQTASTNVKARGTAVYRKGDLIKTVQGDAGKHIVSGTSLGAGHVKILEGHDNVKVNGVPVARHDSRCLINCDASGNGGAEGKLVTEEKSVSSKPAPPGEDTLSEILTSPRLEALKMAREAAAAAMADMDAADENFRFKEANDVLDGWMHAISAPGTSLDPLAQVTRGLLGFGKDFAMGSAETGYEGLKMILKFGQSNLTQSGRLVTVLDAQIIAENIKLGNINVSKVSDGALSFGRAIVKPVSDPWSRRQYVETVTRAAAEIGTLGMGLVKGVRAASAARVVKKAAAATGATKFPLGTAKALDPAASGVHIKAATKPAFSGNWNDYVTHGIADSPLVSAEGKRLLYEFERLGFSRAEALEKAADLMKTGSTLPIGNPIAVGDKFYKVIPEGGTVGPKSAFWATEEQVLALKGASYDEIANRLGIPLVSQQGMKFQVVEISAFRNGMSFTSKIAPTTETGLGGGTWAQKGGDLQTLLVERDIFTQPKIVDISLP